MRGLLCGTGVNCRRRDKPVHITAESFMNTDALRQQKELRKRGASFRKSCEKFCLEGN